MQYIIEGMKVNGVKVPPPNERVLKIILSPELENADRFTLLFSIIIPGNATGLHAHDSDEIMYVAAGRGEGIVGKEKAELKEDTVIFAPKFIEHDVKNTGEETLKVVCMYIPPLKPTGYFKEAIDEAKRIRS